MEIRKEQHTKLIRSADEIQQYFKSKKLDAKIDILLFRDSESKLLPTEPTWMVACVGFLLGAIASGFLSEIGKDLWNLVKKQCRKLQGDLQTMQISAIRNLPDFWICIQYKNYMIDFVIKSANTSDFNKSLEIFFQLIPSEFRRIIELVDEDIENNKDNNSLIIEITINNQWTYHFFKDGFETDNYLKGRKAIYIKKTTS